MAAKVQEMRYAVNGTYGSAAYDLTKLGGYALPEEQTYTEPAPQPRERKRAREYAETRAQAIARAKAAQSISLVSVAGFAAAAVLLVFVLLSYVKLTEISYEVSQLNSVITELDSEQKKLDVEYELAFNKNEIEEYAVHVLGMSKMTEADTTVFSLQREDQAEVLRNDTAWTGVISTAQEFLSSLAEYLRR